MHNTTLCYNNPNAGIGLAIPTGCKDLHRLAEANQRDVHATNDAAPLKRRSSTTSPVNLVDCTTGLLQMRLLSDGPQSSVFTSFCNQVEHHWPSLQQPNSQTIRHEAQYPIWTYASVTFKQPRALICCLHRCCQIFSGVVATQKCQLSRIIWLHAEKFVQPDDNMKNLPYGV